MVNLASSLPPVDTIPITDPHTVALAWELFEVGEERRVLSGLLALQRDPLFSPVAQLHAFEQWQHKVRRRLVEYRASVLTQLEAVGESLPVDLDELVPAVIRGGASSGLLCHAAMLRAYLGITICLSMSDARVSGTASSLEQAVEELLTLEMALFNLERQQAWRETERFAAKGYVTEDWFLVANPFGKNGSGPAWVVNPPEGLDTLAATASLNPGSH
jgi:hypothetical protein